MNSSKHILSKKIKFAWIFQTYIKLRGDQELLEMIFFSSNIGITIRLRGEADQITWRRNR